MLKYFHFVFIVVALTMLATLPAWHETNSDATSKLNQLAHDISIKLSQEIDRVEYDLRMLQTDDMYSNVRYTTYLVEHGEVSYVSDNNYFPDIRLFEGSLSPQLIQLPRGDFLVVKKILPDSSKYLTLLPIVNRYKTNSRYLVSGWNKRLIENASLLEVEGTTSSSGIEVCINSGQCLFKINLSESTDANGKNYAVLAVGFLGLLLLLFGVCIWIIRLYKGRRFGESVLILLASVTSIRIGMLWFGFPSRYISNKYFDPQIFAASEFNPSIADLFFNSLGLLVIFCYLFITYHKFRAVKVLFKKSQIWGNLFSVLFLFLGFLGLLLPYLYIQTVVHNSSISLDITKTLQFDVIRILALLSFLVGCVAAFFFVHVNFKLAKMLSRNGQRFILTLIVAFGLFVGYFLFEGWSYWLPAIITLIYFLLIFLFKVPSGRYGFNKSTFAYLFSIIFMLSLMTALSIWKFNEEEKRIAQIRFGNSFLSQRDVLAEFMLDESMQRIAADPFIQTRLTSPFLTKSPIRQKVRRIHLNAYFGRYELQVYLFNGSGEPIDNISPENLSEFVKNYQDDAIRTDYAGIYLVSKDDPQSSRHYLVIVPIKRLENPIGFIALTLRMKRNLPQNVFPELLVDNRFAHYYEDKDFSHAVISNNVIRESFGDFNYEHDFEAELLENPKLYEFGIRESGFVHVGIEQDEDRIAIVSAPVYPWFFVVTNFSFHFLCGLGVLFIVLLAYGIRQGIVGSKLSYAARIQAFVFIAFILPLLAVSFVSLNLTARSAKDQQNSNFINRSRALAFEISSTLNEFLNSADGSLHDFETRLVEMARISNVDVTVYGVNGKLVASSQPLVFSNQLFSEWMNRQAWQNLVLQKENYIINNEQIGLLFYNASYVRLVSSSGALIGYLSIPFFESAKALEESQIIVLANILNIFSVLFIFFALVSVYASEWLTFPLRFITKRLRLITLTGTNQKLSWNSNDEIGLMIKEYNRMVENLEKSKLDLERIQKESAWREIAQQVAHEIKNPITPMKLTLQQMERDLLKNEIGPEKLKKSLQLLLNQIEILNEIAASFSAFARMPAPIPEKVDLMNLLNRVVNLHKNDALGKIIFNSQTHAVDVLGDEKMLSRIFSNVILNAFQSASDERELIVEVELSNRGNTAQIGIKDNGNGIEKSLRDKVFLPKFSTKETGSGIGLSIARQGIDQMGGKIWFESESGKGTTFIIELPLLKK